MEQIAMTESRVLTAQCDNCGAKLAVKTRQREKTIACPKCNADVHVCAEDLRAQKQEVPASDMEFSRGAAIAKLFNVLGAQSGAKHPDDLDAAATEAPNLELQATCSTCEACYRFAPTKKVSFGQLIGLVIFFQIREIKGNLCKECIKTYYTEFTSVTALAGWWSITLFITPFALIWNTVNYLRCLSLKPGPGQSSRFDIGPVVAIILAAAPFIAIVACWLSVRSLG